MKKTIGWLLLLLGGLFCVSSLCSVPVAFTTGGLSLGERLFMLACFLTEAAACGWVCRKGYRLIRSTAKNKKSAPAPVQAAPGRPSGEIQVIRHICGEEDRSGTFFAFERTLTATELVKAGERYFIRVTDYRCTAEANGRPVSSLEEKYYEIPSSQITQEQLSALTSRKPDYVYHKFESGVMFPVKENPRTPAGKQEILARGEEIFRTQKPYTGPNNRRYAQAPPESAKYILTEERFTSSHDDSAVFVELIDSEDKVLRSWKFDCPVAQCFTDPELYEDDCLILYLREIYGLSVVGSELDTFRFAE